MFCVVYHLVLDFSDPQGCSPNLENGTKFILNDRDFERSSSGEALICDPRNDEHRIMSQITVAFMTLHNMFVDEGLTFAQARDAVILEWQAIVLDDLLPNLVDTSVSEEHEGHGAVVCGAVLCGASFFFYFQMGIVRSCLEMREEPSNLQSNPDLSSSFLYCPCALPRILGVVLGGAVSGFGWSKHITRKLK